MAGLSSLLAVGFSSRLPKGIGREDGNYFLNLCCLREARTALSMISPSLLPKAAVSIGAGSMLFASDHRLATSR